jgi:hypothetical protein
MLVSFFAYTSYLKLEAVHRLACTEIHGITTQKTFLRASRSANVALRSAHLEELVDRTGAGAVIRSGEVMERWLKKLVNDAFVPFRLAMSNCSGTNIAPAGLSRKGTGQRLTRIQLSTSAATAIRNFVRTADIRNAYNILFVKPETKAQYAKGSWKHCIYSVF